MRLFESVMKCGGGSDCCICYTACTCIQWGSWDLSGCSLVVQNQYMWLLPVSDCQMQSNNSTVSKNTFLKKYTGHKMLRDRERELSKHNMIQTEVCPVSTKHNSRTICVLFFSSIPEKYFLFSPALLLKNKAIKSVTLPTIQVTLP